MKYRRPFFLALTFCALAAFVARGPVLSEPSPDPIPSVSPSVPPAPTPPPTPAPGRHGTLRMAPVASSPGPLVNPLGYAGFVRGADRQSGLIDILKKEDDVFFDLRPDDFDRPFIVAPVLASGVGEDAFAGRIFPTFLLEFHRVGKRVLWIDKNSFFSAPEHSPAANALAISVTDSVINSTPVIAEDEHSGRAIVSAAFFLSDFENVGHDLAGGSDQATLTIGGLPRQGFTIDPARSYLERTKALPKNDELLASLAFVGPTSDDVDAAPDARGVRIGMHYSIVEPPPADGYIPRLADDRVGYFISAQKHFDDDAAATPFVRYIDRWNFNNGPIVYYLTNEIPLEYREPIRKALLEWNVAFAKVGIPNAIVVRDQPDDPSWDPDDVRYSTVRWITSDHPVFSAYGPHIADPRTGEIVRVEIVIDGEAMRTVKRGYSDLVVPARAAALDSSGLPEPAAATSQVCAAEGTCDDFGRDSAQMAALGTLFLRESGASPQSLDAFAGDYLQSVVLHESGHNFGLRHNFISSNLYSLAQIHDVAFTRVHGIVGSVMGYTPVNISAPGKPQGSYFQLRLGPYDEWAIRYGYERFDHVRSPEDELVRLRGIADESSRPEYAYETDEDANGPVAIDPRVATFGLSSDPLGFDRNQLDVVANLLGHLDGSFPRDDEPYSEERQSFLTVMRAYDRAVMLAAKYIGGIYTSRDHRGQFDAEPPTSPVPRETSRRAFALLADNVFSRRAFHFSPQLLSDLATSHYDHRGAGDLQRPDFPVEEYVADVQDDVMFKMFSPDAMSRLADESLKARPGREPMSLADLFGWMEASVWDDLSPGVATIDPLHRALQRRYTQLLIAFSLAPSFVVTTLGYPSDTVPLARFELRKLSGRIDVALRSPRLDVLTRAHLEDLQSRAHHALDPSATRGA